MGVFRKQARRLLAVPFVLDGVETLRDPTPRAKALAPGISRLAQRYPWLPDDPELLVRLQGALGTAGGALLLAGKGSRVASLALAAQSLPTLLAQGFELSGSHSPRESQGRERLIKDTSLLGALVLVATEPKRRPTRLRHKAEFTGKRARHELRRRARRAQRAAAAAAPDPGRKRRR